MCGFDFRQTFTDIEIILVDDGSPDNCGKICDEYAKKDSRVKVIHKENGGQASARNAGLDIAKGDYIGFVDSDDWIESDMYELLYDICMKNNCDMANCTSAIYFKNRKVINGTHPLIIHNRNQAMKAVLEGKLYDEVVWTKLFKRSLLKDIRFNIGIVYEDTAFTYKVIHRCEKVCCIGAPKYNYVKRDDSTMDRAIKNIRIDGVLIYHEMNKFIIKYYPELEELVVLKLANTAMVVLNSISYSRDFLNFKKDYYKVAKLLNFYFLKTINLKDYPRNVKLLLIAVKIHPILYKLLITTAIRGK
ncbi:glycosyltransferase [Neobacillus sp. PS3-34]|uniref:glycosyltransferase n=1 Tax=Neobacillus sp. PS3-34 TaxID=3070678 RepID=UPI0027E0B96A|nr:glycosyltransferase [Neobacillus sp. PS3-34]WML47816.1 glycosyltransferase [Neobacillus sp. PS3-34]